MKQSLHVTTAGTLEQKQHTLAFTSGQETQYLPVETTGDIHVFAEVSVNRSLLSFLGRKGIAMHVYSYYGDWAGSFLPREEHGSGRLLLRQAEAYLDPASRVALARSIVLGSLRNLLRALQYYERREHAVAGAASAVAAAADRAAAAGTVEGLMAAEGHAREEYYRAWNAIFLNPDFVFDRRTRRPPQSEVNALISFGNTLLYTAVLGQMHRTRLDPRIGFLHAATDRPFSLNLDVAEVFKPVVVDRVIFRLVNRRMLKREQFRREGNGVFLDDDGRRIFLAAFEERLGETVYDARAKRSVSFRGLIELELHKLERHLLGVEEYSPYVSGW